MKLFLLIAVTVAVLALSIASSSERYFSSWSFNPSSQEPEEVPPIAPTQGGGSPRKQTDGPAATAPSTSSSPAFHGPSGPPYIVGPNEPPPGQ